MRGMSYEKPKSIEFLTSRIVNGNEPTRIVLQYLFKHYLCRLTLPEASSKPSLT